MILYINAKIAVERLRPCMNTVTMAGNKPLRGSRWLYPLPAELAIGIAAIPFACEGAGFNRSAQDFV